MGSFALIVIFIGVLTLVGLFLWVRQREAIGLRGTGFEALLQGFSPASGDAGNAVLVATEHGQILHINDVARQWLGQPSGLPDLESVAEATQPGDNFFALFTAERQVSFQLYGRWVEAASHFIPAETGVHNVIVLREMGQQSQSSSNSMDMSLAMTIINDINETVNASLGLELTLQVLLELLSRALPSDAGEICIWDSQRRFLDQQGWIGDSRYLLTIAEQGGGYELDEGVAGWIAAHREPVLIRGEADIIDTSIMLSNNPYRSAVAIPLSMGQVFIGTLALFSAQNSNFDATDVAVLQAVSKAISTAINNALLYQAQESRIRDIASLQQIAEQPKGLEGTSTIYGLLNERMAKLLDADMSGVFLYDKEREMLVPQLPFYGLQDNVANLITIPLPARSPQREIWQNQAYWVSNDLKDEPLLEALNLKPIISVAGIRNTGLFPMQIGGERFGLVAISNKQKEGGFTPRDIQSMRVLATQAAIVVENVRLYQQERRIDNELVGLQEMTHAIGALSHEGEFYAEIAERIGRLMGSAMCGILLFDAPRRALIAQAPFFGIPTELIAQYQIPLRAGSVMEELWLDDDFWYSNRVSSDTLVYEAGLDVLAEAVGVQKTLIAVMSAGGRRIGVVQVSNKADGSDFGPNDARLLQIFATQAAAIIENARLYREVQLRAEQAESLRRVAEMASAVLTTDETFQPVLQEISRFIDSPIVYINVLDATTNTLISYPRWTYGMGPQIEASVQDLTQPGYENSVVRSGRAFLSNDVVNDRRVLPGYRQISDRYGIKSAVMVPLIAGDRILGELGVGNRLNALYNDNDIAALSTVAAQIAAALERLLLYEATGENLRRRVQELDSIARISNELAMTVELDKTLNVIFEEAVSTTYAVGGTIVLLRPMDEWRLPDKPEMARRIGFGVNLPNLADIEAEAIMRGADPVLIASYEGRSLKPGPADARSAVAVAFLYQDQIVGVIHVYHTEPNRFDERAAGFLLTLSTKASLAYQSSLYYQQQLERGQRLRQRVEQLNRIFELGQMIQSTIDPVIVLEAVAYSIQQSIGYDTVLMMLVDESSDSLLRVAQAGIPLESFENTRQTSLPLAYLDEFFKPDYQRTPETYFFPIEQVEDWYMPSMRALSTAFPNNRTIEAQSINHWHDGDMLVVKVSGQGGNLMGMISLDRPHDNMRPDRQTIEVLEIFAHQSSTMIENTRLFMASHRNAEQEAQLNELLKSATSTLDINEIASSSAQGIRHLIPLRRLSVVLAKNDARDYDEIYVDLPQADQVSVDEGHRDSLDRTALGRSFSDHQEYLYRSGEEAIAYYQDLREWHAQGEKATLILPLLSGGEVLGALHLGSEHNQTFDAPDIRQMLTRVAQIVSTTIQNARLFNQAMNLQILNRSVVESIQQGIVVLDPMGRIINLNEYMRQIYAWDDEAIGQDLFTYQPDLIEALRSQLDEVFTTGQPHEIINLISTQAEGHISVRNFYLYPLRYGDAVRGAVMLVEDVTERTQLEQTIESRANQLAALTEVSTRITASLERDEVIQLALDEMGWIIPFDTMSIWRRHGSYMVLEGAVGEGLVSVDEAVRVRIGEDERIQQLVDSQRVVIVSDQYDTDFSLLPGEHQVGSWLGVPLVNQGHVVGMLMLTKAELGFYETREEQHVAFAFASQVAIALANADLFEQTFERTNELGTLLEAAQATSLARSLGEVFRIVAELMFSALEMEDCIIMIWDEVDNELEVQFATNRMGQPLTHVEKGGRYSLVDYPARQRSLRDRDVIAIIDLNSETSEYQYEIDEMRSLEHGARMLVPLVLREESIGLIQLEQRSNDEHSITQQKVRLARALGAQVAVAIENARLSQETTIRLEELLTINTLSQAISSTLKLEDMLPVIRDQVPLVTGAEEVYLALYDKETEEINFPLAVRRGEEFYIPPRTLGKDEVSYIIRRRHTLSLGADYFSIDELRRSMGIINGEGESKSYMGVPLISGDQVLGVLAIRNTQRTRAFNLNDDRILSTVGSQLAAAIQNARLFEQITSFADDLNSLVEERTNELEDERDRLDTLYQITSELARTLDMEQLLDRALGMVSKAVGGVDGVIMLSDPATDKLYCRAWLNPANLVFPEGVVPPNAYALRDVNQHPTHPAEGLATWLIQNDDLHDHVIVINDLHTEDYWDMNQPGAKSLRSALAVMLEINEDPMGVMVLMSDKPGAFTENHLKLLVPAANQVAASINSADLYQLIREQAERLGKLLRAEQEDAQKNSAILEGITDGVLLADSSGTIILFNTAAERILQLPREQVLSQPVAKLAGIYGATAVRWTQMVQDWTESLSQPSRQLDYSVERIELGDKIISAQLSSVYIGDLFLGTVSVFRDITRDVEADRIKSEFIENVSHEFRTPLTPIKGYTDLLLMGAGGPLTDMQSNMVQTIKENIERLTVLVNDVLNIAKLDRDDVLTLLQHVDLRELLPLVTDQIAMRPQNSVKELDLAVTIEDNLPLIRADRDKVIQIISNLVDNAFKYTLRGGRIEVVAQRDEDERFVLIRVADTGVGIPDDFKERAWRRFERYDEHALELDVAGTGLGLPLVRELVARHNGRVWFESTLGEGTTFYLQMPIEQPNYSDDSVDLSQSINTETIAGD